MDKYKNKYRIPSARAQWWDYGWNGAYFITMVTQNRKHYFGEIHNGKMELSPVGAIADVLWNEIPNHFEHVNLGESVVMPNHKHGIILLNKPDDALSSPNFIGKNRFQNIGNTTISSIIGSYKAAVTKHANRLGLTHGWQPLFHDHIIRNADEFQRISHYIKNNPKNWKEDRFSKRK